VGGRAIDRTRPSEGSARRIGAKGLVVFYLTSIVGAGILVVPGIAARSAGPASLVAWMALALASFPIALMFAEMSARRPNCGGIAALIRDVLGVRAGDTASLLLIIAYVVNIR
jgi:amino acid efflux transporter